MRGKTHLAMGVAYSAPIAACVWTVGKWAGVEKLEIPVALVTAGVLVGSLAPDVDAQNSTITASMKRALNGNRPSFMPFGAKKSPIWVLLGIVLLCTYILLAPFADRHRGRTHSLTLAIAVAVLGLPLTPYFVGWYLVGLGAGMVVHRLGDQKTVSGVGGKKGKVKTGSIADVVTGYLYLVWGVLAWVSLLYLYWR